MFAGQRGVDIHRIGKIKLSAVVGEGRADLTPVNPNGQCAVAGVVKALVAASALDDELGAGGAAALHRHPVGLDMQGGAVALKAGGLAFLIAQPVAVVAPVKPAAGQQLDDLLLPIDPLDSLD